MKKLEQLGISPAPWSINEDGEVWCKYISNAIQPNKIRTRVVARPNFYFDESKSDAHLIAAAPELYEALLKALPWLADIGEEVVGTEPAACIAEIVKEAEAALAKASGGSEEK